MISIIACVGKNNELGKDNELCFHIKEDMDFFKRKTRDKTVLMGRKTYESIGHPLPYRVNYVVTRGEREIAGVVICTDLNLFLQNTKEEVFVIGGASIYKQALPYTDVIYLTEVDAEADADAFFPEFDKTLFKRKVLRGGEEDGVKFKMVKYTRKEEDGKRS